MVKIETSVFIFGAGGHAKSVINVARALGRHVIACVDDLKNGTSVYGTPVISLKKLIKNYNGEELCIAVGDNFQREKISKYLCCQINDVKFATLAHPTSCIAEKSSLGVGTVVMPLASIGPDSKIGKHVIINSSANVDHDTVMEDFSSIAPGVIMGGNVAIGERSAIAIGSTIIHRVSIGKDTVIGAGSMVLKDVKANILAYGSPCNEIRQRAEGEKYL